MAVTKIRGNTQIVAGSITNTEINASAGLELSKLESVTDGNIIVGSVSNVPTAVAVSGDISLANDGTTAIASGVIVNADINASAAIDFSKLASLTDSYLLVGSAGNVATAVAVSGDISLANDGTTAIASGVIVNADVNASAAIDFSKLAALSDGYILVGNDSNVATAVDVTGDIEISNAGVTSIATGAIVNADVNASAAIVTSKLADSAKFLLNDTNRTISNTIRYTYSTSQTFSNNGDLVTKEYVDSVAQGLDAKDSCRMATTQDFTDESYGASGVTYNNGNGTLTQDDPTDGAFGGVDGVSSSLAVGQRILVKDQDTGQQNGIYEITELGNGTDTAWVLTRTADADEDSEVTAGLYTWVEEGTLSGDNGFVITTNDPITLGTTAIVFSQFSGAGQITAGAGLTKSGNTINFATGDASLVVNADEAHVQLDATAGTIALGGAGLQIADGTSGYILVGQGGGTDTAFKAVSGDISLAADGTTAIASGVIVNADVNASAAIALSKLESLTSARLIVGSAGNVPTAVDVTGDVTISNAGVTAIASGAIVNADVNASAAIDFSKLASLTDSYVLVGSGANVATAVAISGDISLANDGTTAIASGVIVNADVNASAAIDFSKLAALTSGNILVGNVSNVAASVTMSGDGTLSNAGVLSLASNVLKEADIVTREVPNETPNGAITEFTVDNTPVAGTEHVFLNGVLQNQGASNDYTISGSTITFNSAPLTGDIILVSYWK